MVLAACGRIGFTDTSPADATIDATIDGPPAITGGWVKLAVSRTATCGITTTGELWCWGYGAFGQLGIGSKPATASRTKVGDGWRDVAISTEHACGAKLDGSVWCWGENDFGQLGDNLAEPLSPSPVHVMNGAFEQVAVGYEFSCALNSVGGAFCWGRNDEGQLGLANFVQANVPGPVPGNFTAIVAGDAHVCGLNNSGAQCWGMNGSRQLGDGTTINRNVPTPVDGSIAFTQLAAGATFTCGLDAGTTYCWGDGDLGELGLSQLNGSSKPAVQDGPKFTSIAAGMFHACGIASDGLHCWGNAQRGALPTIATPFAKLPTGIPSPTPTALALGGDTTCVIDADQRAYCAGANAGGQAGRPAGQVEAPTLIDDSWARIFAHRDRACGVSTDGTTRCWGAGDENQLGDGAGLDRQHTTTIALVDPTQLELGATEAGAIANGTAYLWGADPVTGFRDAPTVIGAFATIAVGDTHRCESDGADTQCSGDNHSGQLGVDDPTAVSSGFGGFYTRLRASGKFTCGLDNMSAMSCWGEGSQGQLGAGTFGSSTVPVPVSAGNMQLTAQRFALGGAFACALQTEQLFCWGANDRFQLATNSDVKFASPQRIGTDSWTDIAAGDAHACGIKADQTLWCWGHGDAGQLGRAAGDDALKMHQVPGAWQAVACGDRFTCALDTDGHRACFGANDAGQLGNDRAWLLAFTEIQ